MKVSKLIEKLKLCHEDLEVYAYYDGEARSKIDFVFIDTKDTKENRILVLAEKQDVYTLQDKSKIIFYERHDESNT